MNELQRAIEEITFENKNFPRKQLGFIVAHRDEAIPYLHKALEKVIEEKDELDEAYQLHFYALFLLGEFQDRTAFSKIMELVTLPGEVLDYVLGDVVTSGLQDIVYNTYNGDMELLQNTIRNEFVNEFARAGLLRVMAQLYLDGEIEENEWKEFIKQNVHSGHEYNYVYNEFASVICQCHFVDMLPEIRYMLEKGLMDTMCLGEYDSCVDEIFEYHEEEQRFCDSSINTIDFLQGWAMFETELEPQDKELRRKEFEKMLREAQRTNVKQEANRKVGRNDPCPCGSGKKYKFCCLNKQPEPIDRIESAQERNKWLERYPYVGSERQESRVYLEDYFDAESIAIDQLLYLGLMHRPGFIWLKDEKKDEIRCREYLSLAFDMFLSKATREGIKTFEEYDRTFSIHYFCEEWIGKLLELLKKADDKTLLKRVKECQKAMR